MASHQSDLRYEAAVGLDVGGTTLKVVRISAKGKLIAEKSVPTNDDGTTSWLNRARDFGLSVLERCPAGTRLGIAAPGLPARDGRSIAAMPGRLKGLESLNWREWLGLQYPVPVLNDARAALLAETWIGAAKGSRNVLLLTLGTGVGGAAMVD